MTIGKGYTDKTLTEAEVRQIVGEANVVYGDPELMIDYGHDEVADEAYAHMPEVVVKPASADEISHIMRLANRERIPVTPRGAGSGLSGGAVPVYGGVLLSVERMNQILEIDTQTGATSMVVQVPDFFIVIHSTAVNPATGERIVGSVETGVTLNGHAVSPEADLGLEHLELAMGQRARHRHQQAGPSARRSVLRTTKPCPR